MTLLEKLEATLQKQNGLIRTADALAMGISKQYFYDFVQKYQLEKIAQGVYASQNAWIDPMYLLAMKSEQIIYSHDTALFLHNLTDREPLQYTVTVKTGYNPSKIKALGAKVYTIKSELHNLGVMDITTPFGNSVKVYDKERTICDILRSRNSIETQTFQDGIKGYITLKDKNLRLLMQYAKLLKVERILRQYLEVLL